MTINEKVRLSDLLMFQEGEEVNFIVDQVTVASGTVASAQGQIMGQITASGKWAQVAPAAVDGSQNAAGLLITPFTATLGSDLTTALMIVRGPAVVKTSAIAYTSGMTTNQKNAALAQLKALGIKQIADYGA